MRLLGETVSQDLPRDSSDASEFGAALIVSAIGAAILISAIVVLCAGSAAASKPRHTEESEFRQTSNMNQGTSVRSWHERPQEEEPVLCEGTDLVSCVHLVAHIQNMSTTLMLCCACARLCHSTDCAKAAMSSCFSY